MLWFPLPPLILNGRFCFTAFTALGIPPAIFDMVVFQHDHIVKSHPVIGTTSMVYGHFVQYSQGRELFSGCPVVGYVFLPALSCSEK